MNKITVINKIKSLNYKLSIKNNDNWKLQNKSLTVIRFKPAIRTARVVDIKNLKAMFNTSLKKEIDSKNQIYTFINLQKSVTTAFVVNKTFKLCNSPQFLNHYEKATFSMPYVHVSKLSKIPLTTTLFQPKRFNLKKRIARRITWWITKSPF